MSRAHPGGEDVAAGDTLVHQLDPRTKIIGLIALAGSSAITPAGAWNAFGAYLAVLVLLVLLAELPGRYVARRMTVEAPFLIAAAILPFTVEGGAALGATLALKATIGVLAMVVLSSTTPFPLLLRGFEALRAPRLLVTIVAFMWRYLHVVGAEVHRMHVARQARAYQPRWLWQTGAIARGIGALFVRSLERGERVYLAMASRGYRGGLPASVGPPLSLGAVDAVAAAALGAALAGVWLVLL